jgi:hypothetical protein
LAAQVSTPGGGGFGADYQDWIFLPELIDHLSEDFTTELVYIRRNIQQKQDRVGTVGHNNLGGHLAGKKARLPNPARGFAGMIGERLVIYVEGAIGLGFLKQVVPGLGEAKVLCRCWVKHAPII